jgi:phenylpropionate dioxygenase-like ring-hydroxylating dioxygenase large terminal subunit
MVGEFLRDIWYVATWSQDLKPGALVARTLLEEPVVFFRCADGTPAALRDICPHRFAPLSMGTLIGGDRIKCA